MGKQINYYIGFNDFQLIAKQAVDFGCEILKKQNGKFIRSSKIDVITTDVNTYFFYLPQAGTLNIAKRNEEEFVGGYNSSGNVVIEASFSVINHTDKKISRGRLFSIKGYYDENGVWIDRPECIKKIYEKLARVVKKIAPYTEITDVIDIISDDYNKSKEWKHKEYISTELLNLKIESGYRIGL